MKKKDAIQILKVYLQIYRSCMCRQEIEAVEKGIRALKKCRKVKKHGKQNKAHGKKPVFISQKG